MRVSLGGRYQLAEFRRAVDVVMHALEKNGVEELQNVNLYFALYRQKQGIQLVDDTGAAIDHLKLDAPQVHRFNSDDIDITIVPKQTATLKASQE